MTMDNIKMGQRKLSGRGRTAMLFDWSPDRLPEGTKITTETLITFDGDVTHGTLYELKPSRTVISIMHPRNDLTRVPMVIPLLKAGFAVWTQVGRNVNNDLGLVHENTLLDVAAGLEYLREKGFEHITLLGVSGGATLYTYYTEQALLAPTARIDREPGGRRTAFAEAPMPTPDGLALFAPHPGQGKVLLGCIDPSITDETDPLSIDPDLDAYNPANGFKPGPGGATYSEEFVTRYRAAQRARVQRIDDRAREIIARQRKGKKLWDENRDVQGLRRSLATPILTTYRTDADLRCTDLSLDPSDRHYGSITNPRPEVSNYGLVGFGRLTTPEAWLSTWSGLSSFANLERAARGITVPTLVIEYTGDQVVFPAEVLHTVAGMPAQDKTHLRVRGEHFGQPLNQGEASGLQGALAAFTEWVSARMPA